MAATDDQHHSRLYHRLMREYPEIWRDARLLGRYAQLLMIADKYWPDRAPIGRLRGAEQALIECGLIAHHAPDGTYSVRGLDAERNARRNAGRIGAAARWAMPGKQEHRKDEGNGTPDVRRSVDRPEDRQSFMGWRPKADPMLEYLRKPAKPDEHKGQHEGCAVCEEMRPAWLEANRG